MSICSFKSLALDRCTLGMLLKTCTEVGSSASPGILFLCLTSRITTECFLMFNLNFLCCLIQYFLPYPQ